MLNKIKYAHVQRYLGYCYKMVSQMSFTHMTYLLTVILGYFAKWVYRCRIRDVSRLKERLIGEWRHFDHSSIDRAVDQWRQSYVGVSERKEDICSAESSIQTVSRSVQPFCMSPKCYAVQRIVNGEEKTPQNCSLPLGFRHIAGGGPSHGYKQHS